LRLYGNMFLPLLSSRVREAL